MAQLRKFFQSVYQKVEIRYSTSLQIQFIEYTNLFELLGFTEMIWNSKKGKLEPSEGWKFAIFCLYTAGLLLIMGSMLTHFLVTYKTRSVSSIVIFGLALAGVITPAVVNTTMILYRREFVSYLNYVFPTHYKLHDGKSRCDHRDSEYITNVSRAIVSRVSACNFEFLILCMIFHFRSRFPSTSGSNATNPANGD